MDDAELDEAYRTCWSLVYRYAARRVPLADAEDVTAEVFGVAWRRRADVPEGAATLPWLYGVAANVVRNHRRAEGRRADHATRATAGDPPAVTADHADRVTDQGLVDQLLGSLSPAEREAALLVAWEGLTAREAALALGCSATAVRVRLHRARVKLRAARAAALDHDDRDDDTEEVGRAPLDR